MRRERRAKSDGLTAVELVIAIGIVTLLGALVLVSILGFRARTDVSTTANEIVTTLRRAHARTVAAESGGQFGVHFEAAKYVRFVGVAYDPATSSNEVKTLPGDLEISNISLAGGGSDVVFSKVTGRTSAAGTVEIRSKSKPDETATLRIDTSGLAALIGSTGALTGTRITDSRHLHFVLSWSIKPETNLRLVFSDPPNPDVVKDYNTANYFNADKSSFDFSDTVGIGGSKQTIRIWTHALSDTATTLSIRRDRMENTKAVKMYFGTTKDIVSYASDGTVTIGSFGGTMSAP